MQETPIQIGEYSFTILLEPNEPDGFLVTCPALPGLVTEGDTLDEAYAMAKDAVEGYLISLIKHGEPNSYKLNHAGLIYQETFVEKIFLGENGT